MSSICVMNNNRPVTLLTWGATEPSPLAHEILNGRPYTFLDDAPLEERRREKGFAGFVEKRFERATINSEQSLAQSGGASTWA